MSLVGKVAIVTGADEGIGKAIALAMAGQGASVTVDHVAAAERAEYVVKEIEGKGGKAISVRADVSQAAEVTRLVAETVKAFGRVDILVNNAGIEEEEPFLQKTEREWDKVMAVNLKGPFLCSQAVAQLMVRLGIGGTIINISSVHEEIPFPGYCAYCAAKGGLRLLCRDLALELAPHHINVINVAPGAIATPINRRTLSDPAKLAALEREIPLGRVGEPGEVADLVCYLASDQAKYITGTTVVIDGGMMRMTGNL
jgi:glucose 1-dehydrogenase